MSSPMGRIRISVTKELLGDMFRLPGGVTVETALENGQDPSSVIISLIGPDFPMMAEFEDSPMGILHYCRDDYCTECRQPAIKLDEMEILDD